MLRHNPDTLYLIVGVDTQKTIRDTVPHACERKPKCSQQRSLAYADHKPKNQGCEARNATILFQARNKIPRKYQTEPKVTTESRMYFLKPKPSNAEAKTRRLQHLDLTSNIAKQDEY